MDEVKKNRACRIKTEVGIKKGRYCKPKLPAKDMVQIMTKLLMMTQAEIEALRADNKTASFIYVCAGLLLDFKLNEYMSVMDKCMAREAAEAAKA